MSTFLDIALEHAARDWYVFPLKPKGKYPVISKGEGGKGFYDATLDAEQIKAWWAKFPTANVGIACGASDLYVADCDHGLNSEEEFHAWRTRNNLPVTYTVRTGRRTSYAVQMYFRGAKECNGKWELDRCSGEIRSAGGLVMSVGNIHPDTGETYQLLVDAPLAPVPAIIERAVKQAEKVTVAARKAGELITENRNMALCSRIGKFRDANPGVSEESTLAFMQQWNLEECADPMSCDEVEETTRKQFRLYADAEELPEIVIGTPEEKAVTDWRELFHTKDEALNAPPITFLIKDYLMCEGVTGIAAPVRERKSLIALNVVHALLTGEKLFDHFEVVKKPSRVLYLCPEVSLGPFTDRLKKIGLLDYVGETLFYRTLSKDGHLKLNDAALLPALPGSVVILDTAIRFLEGDENSSQDVRAFADSIFALLQCGAESVVMLHHSPKEAGDVMTLENAMRGSGDMGAFLASCWGTRLQDPQHPYESASFVSNLKQRDFESKDFEVTCGADCRLHIVSDPALSVTTLAPRRGGNKGNKDGLDSAAMTMLKANPKLSNAKMSETLKAAGIQRGPDWVRKKRYALMQDAAA